MKSSNMLYEEKLDYVLEKLLPHSNHIGFSRIVELVKEKVTYEEVQDFLKKLTAERNVEYNVPQSLYKITADGRSLLKDGGYAGRSKRLEEDRRLIKQTYSQTATNTRLAGAGLIVSVIALILSILKCNP